MRYMEVARELVRMSLQGEWRRKFALFTDRMFAVLLTGIFLSVWSRLTATGLFAGYTRDEFLTYAILVHVLRPLVFLFKYRVMSDEIVRGTFSLVMTLPISVGWYYYLHSWGERLFYLGCAIGEALLLISLFEFNFILPTLENVCWFGVFLLLAHILSEVGSFFMHTVAFWTTQANGPRFLYDWVAEFMGGLYFPLWLLSTAVAPFFFLAPFYYFLYYPISVYLRGGTVETLFVSLGMVLFWLGLGILAVRHFYRRGLAHYNAEGI